MFSLPANIPVTFEVIILLAAFATFFGMLMLNGLAQTLKPATAKRSFRRVDQRWLFLDGGSGRRKLRGQHRGVTLAT